MNTKITFVELVDLLAESTSTTNRVCELFLRELFNTISQSLIKGRPVTVKGIGEFKVVESVTRKDTDEASAHKRIAFTPDKKLAEALNEPFAQFKTITLDDEVTDEQLAEIDERFPSTVIPPPSEEDLPAVEDIARMASTLAVALEAAQLKDMPEKIETEPAPAPEPEAEHIPAAETTDKPKPVTKPVVEPEEKPHIGPAMATSVEHEPVKRKPMLIGIPIDGPSQPTPEPEPVEEDVSSKRFYRPELRNTYTPTPEQIEEANQKPTPKWWIPLLGLIAVAALMWWLFSNNKNGGVSGNEEHVVMAADTISENDSILMAEEKPVEQKSEQEKRAEKIAKTLSSSPEGKPVEKPAEKPIEKATAEKPATTQKQVTDIVTSQIVLTTLAEKHYGSPWFWVYIYEENKSIISNPNNIKPGTSVVIPPPEKYGINPNDKASLKKAQVKSWQYLKGK